MTEHQAKVVMAFAKNNMRAKDTGKYLHVVEQDVHYHLRRVKEITGLDPKNFFELCRLVGIAASVTGGNDEEG